MFKKFILSAGVIVVFTLYALRLHFGDGGDGNRVIAINTPVPTSTPEPTPTTAAGSSNPPTVAPIATSTPQGKYKDGTYTGSVADAFYGNIQVQAVISGGKLTDVIFLQAPNDRGTSIAINSQADPLLKQEAIQAQSANVSGVSGATASSGAFVQSLGDALKQAAI